MSIKDEVIRSLTALDDKADILLARLKQGEKIRPDEIWQEYIPFSVPSSNMGFLWNWGIPLHSVWPLFEKTFFPIVSWNYWRLGEKIQNIEAFRRCFNISPNELLTLVERGRVVPILKDFPDRYSDYMFEAIVSPLVSRDLPYLGEGVHRMVAHTWQFQHEIFPPPREPRWDFLMNLVGSSSLNAVYIGKQSKEANVEALEEYLCYREWESDWPLLLQEELTIQYVLKDFGVFFSEGLSLEDYESFLDEKKSKALKNVVKTITSSADKGEMLKHLQEYNHQLEALAKNRTMKGVELTGSFLRNNSVPILLGSWGAVVALMNSWDPTIGALLGSAANKLDIIKLPGEVKKAMDQALRKVGERFVPPLSKLLRVSPDVIYLGSMKEKISGLRKSQK